MKKEQTLRFTVRLWGEKIQPEIVTQYLKLEPKYSYEKGYERKVGEKFAKPKELGIWVYEHIVDSSFEDELGLFVQKFNGTQLREIPGVQIAIMDLYFGLSDTNANLPESHESRIELVVLTQLQKLGVDVRITIS